MHVRLLFSSTLVLFLTMSESFLLQPSLLTAKVCAHKCALFSSSDDASRYRQQAELLREQIRKMEEQLLKDRPRNYDLAPSDFTNIDDEFMSLKGKRILVTGANGRLGSMVCRYLLRNHPQTEVVAAVHYVGENSSTARGYGRLAYEIGAEDGVGTIGPAWSAEERTASFRYSDEMKDYNLQNIRLVEVELLDQIQCNSIMEGVDSVIWCATDFNGNKPRAVSGLNVAFLFRAIVDPMKGRVEIEGFRNILGSLKQELQSRRGKEGSSRSALKNHNPVNIVLVSATPEAYNDFETPFGSFNGLKRQAETMLHEDFPSLTYVVLQMAKFEDNFVDDGLVILTDDGNCGSVINSRRRINRRDAARAASDALIDNAKIGKVVQVYTTLK